MASISIPNVLNNSQLRRKWNDPFETAEIEEATYDLAISINVGEHIAAPGPFFEKVYRVLKPGGIYWAYTPHAWHPSAFLSRSLELLGTKGFFAKKSKTVNDYPAYYRMNSQNAVCRSIEHLPFQSAQFYLLPADGWKNYFPRSLRRLPEAYEALMRGRSFCVIAYRLQKAD